MKTFRNPAGVHAPLAGYAHGVEIGPGERLLFLSGQIGMRADGSVPGSPLEQLEVALANVFHNLNAADMTSKDLLKLTFYHVGEIDGAKRQALVASKLAGHEPCMTLLFVAALASPALKVEVEAIASRTV